MPSKCLAKSAELRTELLPHQSRVVGKMRRSDQSGLVVAHGLGSGKTLTSIAVQDDLGVPATIVVPASLQENYRKEQRKHLIGRPHTGSLTTLQAAARRRSVAAAPLLILDEAHRIRNPQSAGAGVIRAAKADKKLLLTASPFYNHPSDLSTLVNVVANNRLLPESAAEFDKAYSLSTKIKPSIYARLVKGVRAGATSEINPETSGKLKTILNKFVDYHPNSEEHFPKVTREDIQVEMTADQLDVYDTLAGKVPRSIRNKVLSGLPPSKAESGALNAFIGAARQISNSTRPFISEDREADEPKIDVAFNRLKSALEKDPRAKAAVYSNYVSAGIDPYKAKLIEEGIPFGEFTGRMNKRERDELVHKYNNGEIKTILLSSAGGEGLDLSGTRLIQVLEPHWNEEKLSQIEGRGIRYKSHDHLPKEDRTVHVERYVAVRPKSGIREKIGIKKPGLSADEYLIELSKGKSKKNKQFKELLKTSTMKDLPDQLKKLAAKIDAKIKGEGSTRKGDETPDKGQDSTESKEVGTKENKENPAITSKGLPIDAKKQNDKKLGGELPADPTEMI